MLQFDNFFGAESSPEKLSEGAVVLREFALKEALPLIEAVREITAIAPFRGMQTRGGLKMSLMSTGCGALDWLDDYDSGDYPQHDGPKQALPPIPAVFIAFAEKAAKAAGYEGFVPDACLINRYFPGASLGLHQDKDERDIKAPIISVSLGLPITFLFGGLERGDKARRIPLDHGDVVVWGGPSRMAFHGVSKLKEGLHPLLGRQRINLTFRKIRR